MIYATSEIQRGHQVFLVLCSWLAVFVQYFVSHFKKDISACPKPGLTTFTRFVFIVWHIYVLSRNTGCFYFLLNSVNTMSIIKKINIIDLKYFKTTKVPKEDIKKSAVDFS